jgi:TrmH family RNA methyltransferase
MLPELPRLPLKLRNELRGLHRAPFREEVSLYMAEGAHLCRELAAAGHPVDVVVLRDDAAYQQVEVARRLAQRGARLYACGEKDMELLTDTQAPQSIVAIARYHSERPLGARGIALDAVGDPGNVGTIIRCAAWFGFSDVVLGMQSADLYNSKTMRATSGAALRVNVIRQRRLPDWLKALDKRPVVAAVPRGGEPPGILSQMRSFILVIGSEAHGITPAVMDLATHSVSIPGLGETESLNAAMAAAVLAYEGRQR